MANAASGLDCEVLVVGAGPTGLMAANLLRRSGVQVRVVERRAEATRESRAFAVQARTLELMQSLGLDQTFISRGVMATGIDIHVRGKHRGGLDLDLADAPDTPFQYILMIPQSQTEAILIEDLRRLGVEVERGFEVTGAEQDSTGVRTDLRQADGATSRIRSAYVIGADGSWSAVRTAAGIGWTGDALPQRFLLADCKVEWPFDHQRFRVFMHGRRIGLFLPLDGARMSRVMATELSGDAGDGDASKPEPLDLKEIEAGFAAAAGVPLKLSDPVWVTRYKAHHRAVDVYSKGRIFVAGDAAHIHSPAGGQGMNTGLQDAANLAWKIAAVLRRGADDELLDTYHDERKPVGELVVRSTGRLFAATAGQAGFKAAVRDRIAAVMLKIVTHARPIQRKAFMGISERNIAYERSRYVCEGPSWPRQGPRAGARAPNARINPEHDVFDLLRDYRWNLLAFSKEPLSPADAATVRAELNSLAQQFGDLGAHVIARFEHGLDPNALLANGPEAFDRYGVSGATRQALYLIRPDGYVAWRSAGLDLVACRRFLEEIGFAAGVPAQRVRRGNPALVRAA